MQCVALLTVTARRAQRSDGLIFLQLRCGVTPFWQDKLCELWRSVSATASTMSPRSPKSGEDFGAEECQWQRRLSAWLNASTLEKRQAGVRRLAHSLREICWHGDMVTQCGVGGWTEAQSNNSHCQTGRLALQGRCCDLSGSGTEIRRH